MDDLHTINKALPEWLIDELPEYKSIEYIEQSFDDSTHKLWRLMDSKKNRENHFLKLCNQVDSPFWQVMSELFDYDLYSEINSFSETYAFIDTACSLVVPKLITAKNITTNLNKNTQKIQNDRKAFILTKALAGTIVVNEDSDGANSKFQVQQLAKHLAELHDNAIQTWGSLSDPTLHASDWGKRLEVTLIKSAKKWGGVFLDPKNTAESICLNNYLKEAIEVCSKINVTEFVPIMPDLRWDQFFQVDGKMTALLDLDAFVFAPRALDFVILEYLLLPNQLEIFITEYSKYHVIPDIKESRIAYRLLLFFMQILGEDDLNKWMNREVLF